MRLLSDGTTAFLCPNGSVLDAAPELPVTCMRLDAPLSEPDGIPVWDGTRFDLAYAIDVLYPQPCGHGRGVPARATG